MSFRFLKIKYIITLLKNKNIMVYVKNRTIDDIRNKYQDTVSFHNDGVDNLRFLNEADAISFFKKREETHIISSLRINLYIKIHQLLDTIKNFLFLLKNSIKERYFKIKDALCIRDLTKVSFDYKNHNIRSTGIITYKRDAHLNDENTAFSEDESAISIVNKKTFLSEKIFQTSKISISDLSVNEKINNKDYINLKTEQYERTTRIKEFLVFVIGGIIGALCVCFGWMATILLEAWQKDDIMYIFDKANYISYGMTTLFIIAMIVLLYIKNKYLDKTGIIADIDQIMGIKNDPSACWKFIDGDKFKTCFLEFLKDIMDDDSCKKIFLLKKNFREIYHDVNSDGELYNDKKIEIQNRILSVLKEGDFSIEKNNKHCHPRRALQCATIGDPLGNSHSLSNNNASNIGAGGFPNSNKRESCFKCSDIRLMNAIRKSTGLSPSRVVENPAEKYESENDSASPNLSSSGGSTGDPHLNFLTLTTNQIHKIFEILIEYKNYTVVMSKNGTQEEQYDICQFLKLLFADLSKPHQNLNFDGSGKIVVNVVG